MDCSQIRDSFLGSVQRAELSQAELDAHLANCPQCKALFEQDAELGRTLAAGVSASPSFPDDLFEQLEQKVARESGVRAWLRSRPTRLRFVTALSLLLIVVIGGGLLRHRADFAEYPALRVVLLLCVYFVAIALAFAKELSVQRRPNALSDYLGLLAFGLSVPVLAMFAPATDSSRYMSSSGALSCFCYGALFTLPIALLLWAFDRDQRPALRTVCLSAAALGLAANLLLELHCSNGNPMHVLLGHASLGLAWLAAWGAVRGLSRA